MNRGTYLSHRLEELLLSGTWIANTNFKDQLTQIPFEMAIAKTQHHNSIASLCFHINYYLYGLIEAFTSSKLDMKDSESFSMPPVNTASQWQEMVERFIANSETLVTLVSSMDEPLLEKDFFDKKYGTYLRNIDAFIEHGYYHLGQIVLLRKLLFTNNL